MKRSETIDEHHWLVERFEENRCHLAKGGYRVLGSLSEVDDAVREAWLRLTKPFRRERD
jgi:hypothetical protein